MRSEGNGVEEEMRAVMNDVIPIIIVCLASLKNAERAGRRIWCGLYWWHFDIPWDGRDEDGEEDNYNNYNTKHYSSVKTNNIISAFERA